MISTDKRTLRQQVSTIPNEQVAAPIASVDGLYRLLTDEITSIRASVSRSGWNTWVLAAAFAGAAYAAMEVWRATTPNMNIIYKALVAMSIVVFVIVPSFGDAESYAENNDENRKRPARHMLYSQRPALFVMASFASALALATLLGRDGVATIVTWTAATLFISGAVLFLGMFVMSFAELPIPVPTASSLDWRAHVAVNVAVWALSGWLVVSYMRAIPQLAPGTPLGEVRFAAFVVAGGLMLRLLAGQSRSDPALNELVQIRRALSLGHMSLPDATRATEIAILGMDGSANIERHLRRSAQLLDSCRRKQDEASRAAGVVHSELNALAEAAWGKTDWNPRDEDLERIDTWVESAEEAVRYARKTFIQLPKRMEKLQAEWDTLWASNDHSIQKPENVARIQSVHGRIQAALIEVPKRLDEVDSSIQQLRLRLAAHQTNSKKN